MTKPISTDAVHIDLTNFLSQGAKTLKLLQAFYPHAFLHDGVEVLVTATPKIIYSEGSDD